MLPFLQAGPSEVIMQFFGLGFGGLEIAGVVIFLVFAYAMFKIGAPMVTVAPLAMLVLYGLWQSVGGLFSGLWVLGILVIVGVSGFALWSIVNK